MYEPASDGHGPCLAIIMAMRCIQTELTVRTKCHQMDSGPVRYGYVMHTPEADAVTAR